MGEPSWHYQNRENQQIGPVDAELIGNAYRTGELTLDSLVWREGMATWAPLREVQAELGLAAAGADTPAAAAAAYYQSRTLAQAEVVPAGFVRRWAALFIDGLVLIIPATVLSVATLTVGAPQASDENQRLLLFYTLFFAMSALYFATMESSPVQATLGKRALGIKVADEAGRRLSFGHALGRWFSAALSYLTLYVGFLMAAFTERKRALHDMVSSTQVVDKYAYTATPHLQKQSLSGCLLALVIGMLLVVPLTAILAAIAISQYQDYVVRSQVSEGGSMAEGVKTAVAEFYANRNAYPTSNEEAGLPAPGELAGAYVSRVSLGEADGRIHVAYSSALPQKANAAINGAELLFTPTVQGSVMAWQCSSDTVKQKHCPSSCDCL